MKKWIITMLVIIGPGIVLLMSFTGCGSSGDGFLKHGSLSSGSGAGTKNTPPVANAGPDKDVVQWTQVFLDGSSSNDPDADTLSYSWSFESCPQFKCPTLTGNDTAGPSFTAEREGTYVLRLTVYDRVYSSATDTVNVASSPSDPNLLKMQWQYGTFGQSIGMAGLYVSDMDGDGTREIIAAASVNDSSSNFMWYILRHTAGATTYEQIWRSGLYAAALVRLVIAEVNGDGHDDIIAGLSDGTIRIYDGLTRQDIKSLSVAASLTALAVSDINQDGKKEIVTSNGTGVFAYALESGELLWSISTGGGNSLTVGNVDADPALEIVTTTKAGMGYVIDGATHAVEWQYGFGALIQLGDLDGDSMQEIIGASWQKITVFDSDRKMPTWELVTNQDIGALIVDDTNGDGVPEILYGDGQWGKIHSIDVITHTETWSINNPEHGVSGIAFADVDQDGKKEVLWGAGGTSSGPDHLYFGDPSTATIEWETPDLESPLSAVSVGDVDDDGQDEIVLVSFSGSSGTDGGIIHIFNARTNALEFQQNLGIMDWIGNRSVRIGDVDDDHKTDFVVTTGDVFDGVIRIYSGATHTVKCESADYYGNFFSSLAIGDVDGDGHTEIIAGQGKELSGAQGVYLIVFNGATLEEKWRSTNLLNWGSVYDIELADLDRDGHIEIVASLTGNRLMVYDGVTHDLQLMKDHPARALEVADIDGDSVVEILVGRADGKIDVFDGSSFEVKNTVSTFDTSSISALKVADLDGIGSPEWLVTRGNVLLVLDGLNHGLKWKSPDLSWNVGLYNHLGVQDTDGDGRKEIFVGSNLAVYQFE